MVDRSMGLCRNLADTWVLLIFWQLKKNIESVSKIYLASYLSEEKKGAKIILSEVGLCLTWIL